MNESDVTPVEQDSKPIDEVDVVAPSDFRPGRSVTVAVTGATGFVGRHVCRRLTELGHRVRALVHSSSKAGVLPHAADRVEGGIFDQNALDQVTRGADACIHLIGIISEEPKKGITFDHLHVDATRAIVEACKRQGVGRYVHMSALGSRPNAVASYHRTKYEAEQIVRASSLAWTIFRPSLIHGPDGEFTEMVSRWARGTAPPFLFMPYFGAGAFGFGRRRGVQPIYVGDIAELFSRALTTEQTIGEIYPVGGPDRMTWPAMFLKFRDAILGSRGWRPAFPIPAWKAKMIARTADAIGVGRLLPFNLDQVQMSQEDSTCDTARAEAHFRISLTPFDAALDEYAAGLASSRPF